MRIDARGVIVGWNRASEELYGLVRSSAIGQGLANLLDEAENDWRDRLQGVDSWEGEVIRSTAMGPMLMQLRWRARRDPCGAISEIIETGRSAPELGRLRGQLRSATHRFDNLFQALAVSFFETDFRMVGSELMRMRDLGVTDLREYLLADYGRVRALMELENVVDVNVASLRLFGANERSELMGRRSSRLWPDESIPDYVGALVAVMDKQPHFVCETRLRALDGSLIDALFTVAWSPESAKRGIMVVGVVDLRAQKQAFAELQRSEEKFRRLFDAMSIGLLEYDFSEADRLLACYRDAGVSDLAAHLLANRARMQEMIDAMRVGAINDRALEIFGLARETVRPTGVGWLWPPETWEIVARAVNGRFHKRTIPPEDNRIRRPDGSEVDINITLWAAPERRPSQPVLCGVIDISARIAAQQRLELIRTEFAHASRIATLGELAASVAHEISQPLSAIIANSGTAIRTLHRDAPRLPLLRSLAEHTLGAAKRAAEIVARIRSVVAPATQERQPLSLETMVSEALPFVRHELKHGLVELTLRFEPGLPLVSGDRVQLQQIVVNLVLNAVQAMHEVPEDKRRLEIFTGCVDDMVTLTVDDSGPGFVRGTEERLFDSFYTTKPLGMGIGLAVCRSIAESHGGTIAAITRRCGARFVLSLPHLAAAEDEPISAGVPSTPTIKEAMTGVTSPIVS
ncbi:ATP-binding protein [Sphingomonas sp. NBWT7]|uniref:PAS domain-containing sensor histidine kinase n=1 Tax=Sphingomonas sp. NBWT7 TaxID=2596913 RepID=UPI001625E3FB|nr:ATP-binding protein [Sphingomonas sp. NBWT7]